MRLAIVMVLLFSVVLFGCSNARIYTFEKDRVDQTRVGNRGYIIGTPPPAPAERTVPKRTLFGLDIEVPLLPGEKGYVPTEGGPIQAEDIKMTPKKSTPKVEVKEVITEEEEWVK